MKKSQNIQELASYLFLGSQDKTLTHNPFQILSIYMGSVYNLVDWWEPYKASKAALNNTTQTNNIKQVVLKYIDKLQVRTKIKDY